MTFDRGFVLLWRRFWDNAMLKEPGRPFSKREAWLFLFSNLANGIERNGMKRGEFEASVRFLAKRWLWSIGKVHSFLLELQRNQMIAKIERSAERSAEHFPERFTICKYEVYQGVVNARLNAKLNAKLNKSNKGSKQGVNKQSSFDLENDQTPPLPSEQKPAPPARQPNVPFEIFKAKFEETLHEPYAGSKGDFVQLAGLIKRYGITTAEVPPNWELACDNYLHSELGTYSLADLCRSARYPVFVKSQLNAYSRPKEKSLHDQLFGKH